MRRFGSPSPTANATWRIPTGSTCRSIACCPRHTPASGRPQSTWRALLPASVPASLLGADQPGDTTCLCTADGAGNAVCLLQSIQTAFGSCVIAGGTGVLLNNRMTYWHLKADHPNVLAPGKRVRHTMNPVIATRAGRPVIVCGTPGADTQVQTNLQLLTNAIHFGMTPQEAVEAPRWRSLQNPMESTLPHTCEDRLDLETRFRVGGARYPAA